MLPAHLVKPISALEGSHFPAPTMPHGKQSSDFKYNAKYITKRNFFLYKKAIFLNEKFHDVQRMSV